MITLRRYLPNFDHDEWRPIQLNLMEDGDSDSSSSSGDGFGDGYGPSGTEGETTGDFFGDSVSNADFFGDTSTAGDFFGDSVSNADFFGNTSTSGDFFGDSVSNADFFGTTSTSGDFFGDSVSNADFFGDTSTSGDYFGDSVSNADFFGGDSTSGDFFGDSVSNADFFGTNGTAGDFFGDSVSNADFFGTGPTSGDYFGDSVSNADFFGTNTTGSTYGDYFGDSVSNADFFGNNNAAYGPDNATGINSAYNMGSLSNLGLDLNPNTSVYGVNQAPGFFGSVNTNTVDSLGLGLGKGPTTTANAVGKGLDIANRGLDAFTSPNQMVAQFSMDPVGVPNMAPTAPVLGVDRGMDVGFFGANTGFGPGNGGWGTGIGGAGNQGAGFGVGQQSGVSAQALSANPGTAFGVNPSQEEAGDFLSGLGPSQATEFSAQSRGEPGRDDESALVSKGLDFSNLVDDIWSTYEGPEVDPPTPPAPEETPDLSKDNPVTPTPEVNNPEVPSQAINPSQVTQEEGRGRAEAPSERGAPQETQEGRGVPSQAPYALSDLLGPLQAPPPSPEMPGPTQSPNLSNQNPWTNNLPPESPVSPPPVTPAQAPEQAKAGEAKGTVLDAPGKPSFYAPGRGGDMEGPNSTAAVGPNGLKSKEGGGVPQNLQDVADARAKGGDTYVTLAAVDGRDSKGNRVGGDFFAQTKGQTRNIPSVTFRGADGKNITLNDVKGVVHDRGPGRAGTGPAHFDIALGGKNTSDNAMNSASVGGSRGTTTTANTTPTPGGLEIKGKAPAPIVPFAPSPETPDVKSARDYLAQTSKQGGPGSTMSKQGVEVAIGRLAPDFAKNLARAIEEARGRGINAYVFSAARTGGGPLSANPDFKGKTVHATGAAVDIGGIDKAGSKTAQEFHAIAKAHNVLGVYGPFHNKEWNHFQGVPSKTYQGATGKNTPAPTEFPASMVQTWADIGQPGGSKGVGSDVVAEAKGALAEARGAQALAALTQGAKTAEQTTPTPQSRPSDAPYNPGLAAGKNLGPTSPGGLPYSPDMAAGKNLGPTSPGGMPGTTTVAPTTTAPVGIAPPGRDTGRFERGVDIPGVIPGKPGIPGDRGVLNLAPGALESLLGPGLTNTGKGLIDALSQLFAPPDDQTLYGFPNPNLTTDPGGLQDATPYAGPSLTGDPGGLQGATPSTGPVGAVPMSTDYHGFGHFVGPEHAGIPVGDPGGLQDATPSTPSTGFAGHDDFGPETAPEAIDEVEVAAPTVADTAPDSVLSSQEAPSLEDAPGILASLAAVNIDGNSPLLLSVLASAQKDDDLALLAAALKLAESAGIGVQEALQLITQQSAQGEMHA